MIKKIILFSTLVLALLQVPNFSQDESNIPSNIVENISTNSMTPQEKIEEHDRQVEEVVNQLKLRMSQLENNAYNSHYMPFASDAGEYKTETGSVIYRTAEGYAGNQPKGGIKFSTGGGFYYSDSGGPSVSLSATFPQPFNFISISATLGKSASSGIFVIVPDKTNYYKLYIEKNYELRPYIVYFKQYDGDDGSWEWVELTRGASKILDSFDAYAKKVN